MIQIDNTCVFGLEGALRSMRYPMNSDMFSDTEIDYDGVHMGERDAELAQRLAKAGTDHGKFLRTIHVQCDITAPHYFFYELDTYKVGTVSNSRSKMHKLLSKPFTVSDFSFEDCTDEQAKKLVRKLNKLRDKYLSDTDPKHKKIVWRKILQLLPLSYNQQRFFDCNYAVLRNIYFARKNHKLSEWHEFCNWIEGLPYADVLITCDGSPITLAEGWQAVGKDSEGNIHYFGDACPLSEKCAKQAVDIMKQEGVYTDIRAIKVKLVEVP